MTTDPFAGARREVRSALTGRTLEAVDTLTDVNRRWVARLEAARHRNTDREARAVAFLTECERIAALMRDRGWDVYRVADDDEAR